MHRGFPGRAEIVGRETFAHAVGDHLEPMHRVGVGRLWDRRAGLRARVGLGLVESLAVGTHEAVQDVMQVHLNTVKVAGLGCKTRMRRGGHDGRVLIGHHGGAIGRRNYAMLLMLSTSGCAHAPRGGELE